MECPNCGKETHKISITALGATCINCQPLPDCNVGGGVIVRGENKYKPKLTRADLMHIKTRRIGNDGMVHAHPRWETKDF